MRGDLQLAQLFEVNTGELAWSYTFLSLASRPFLCDVEASQLEIGRAFDRHHAAWDPHPFVRRALPLVASHGEEPPSIIQHVRGMCLVMKPPGWEVDTEGNSGIRRLSGFLQAALPPDRRAVAFRPDFGFGFIHRLDTPSSGLILTATSFEGYCCLEWQMYTYTIDREYFVMGQGVAKVPEWKVVQRILDTDTAQVAPNGRPAKSHIRFLFDAGLDMAGKYCAVAIHIYTGRRHQIRVHMRYCDCASVADHRYGPGPSVFLRAGHCVYASEVTEPS